MSLAVRTPPTTTDLKSVVAKGLLIAALILIVIYVTADPIVPNKETRAFYFTTPAVVMSIVAFGISFKEKSTFLSILLLVNGVILVVDGIMVSYNNLIRGFFASQASGFVLALVVLGLGVVKSVMTFRKTPQTQTRV